MSVCVSRFNDFCGDSVLRFIKQGKVLYADEQKVQDLISQQRINLADVKYLDLDRVNIILNLFVNPQTENSGEIQRLDCPPMPYGMAAQRGGLSAAPEGS